MQPKLSRVGKALSAIPFVCVCVCVCMCVCVCVCVYTRIKKKSVRKKKWTDVTNIEDNRNTLLLHSKAITSSATVWQGTC